jgi:hypothetical protein
MLMMSWLHSDKALKISLCSDLPYAVIYCLSQFAKSASLGLFEFRNKTLASYTCRQQLSDMRTPFDLKLLAIFVFMDMKQSDKRKATPLFHAVTCTPYTH